MMIVIQRIGLARLFLSGLIGLGLVISPWTGAGSAQPGSAQPGTFPPGGMQPGGPMAEPPLSTLTVSGKYANLLRKLHVPDDIQTYT